MTGPRLIADAFPARPHALSLALTRTIIAFVTTALVMAQDPSKSREMQVLELFERIPTSGARLYSASLGISVNEYGYEHVAPRGVGCGFGWQPAFDPGLARALAREMCAIYGLKTRTNVPAPGGVEAVVDAFDADRGVGLELRGKATFEAGRSWPRIEAEPADEDLDVKEHERLREAGVRVHTVSMASYWGGCSGDQLTTTLAYLVDVAAFLNDVTDGDDVDCRALLPLAGRWLTIEVPRKVPGTKLSHWPGGWTANVTRRTVLELGVDPATAVILPTTPARVVANAGRPVFVQLFGLTVTKGSLVCELLQAGADGEERVLGKCTGKQGGGILFVPGAFDSRRPFTVRLQLDPGEYRITDRLWISGADE